jgi:Flp pilus assembly protein TadG
MQRHWEVAAAPAQGPIATDRPSAVATEQRARRDGQALIMLALFSFVLVGFTALSIDAGFVLAERRQAQSAADAAALAAARAIYDNRPGDVVNSARTYATVNAGADANVQVLRPPTSGAYAGNSDYIQVVVRREVRRFFVGAVYSGSWEVTATAVAGIEQQPGNYALITLSRNREPGIYINGNSGILVSGTDASAMSNTNIASNGTASFFTVDRLDANGTIQAANGLWTPPARRHPGTPQIDDPLAGLPVPPKGTSRTFAASCPGNVCQPGWYRNQSLTVDRTVTFAPGVYWFENTHIDLKNNGLLRGTGVLLYFDSNSTFDPKNGDVDLRANQSNPLYLNGQVGLTFWYARCGALDLQGNGTLYFHGIFYAPCADVRLHGNTSSDTLRGQLFVNTLDIRGTSTVRITYEGFVNTDRPRVFLVE